MENNDDIDLLQQLIAHGGTQAFSLVPAALKKVLLEQQWRMRVDKHGKPFVSFEAFAKHRLWQGLETTVDDLRVHCRKHPDIERLLLVELEPGRSDGGDRRSPNFQSDNVTLKRGNSAIYTVKRIKRDHPELFQQVLGGGLSIHAAAVEAGIHKPPSPLKELRKWWSKASADERAAFLAEISEQQECAA